MRQSRQSEIWADEVAAVARRIVDGEHVSEYQRGADIIVRRVDGGVFLSKRAADLLLTEFEYMRQEDE